MADPAFRSFSSFAANFPQTSSWVVPAPAGLVDGDIMIAIVTYNGFSKTVTPPAGWATQCANIQIASSGEGSVIFSKVAASEGANFTFGLSAVAAGGVSIIAIQDASSIEGGAGEQDSGVGVTSISPGPLTPSDAPALMVAVAQDANDAGTITDPSGYTRIFKTSWQTGDENYAAYFLLDPAAAEQPTIGFSVGQQVLASLFAFLPAVTCNPPENDGGSGAPSITGTAEVGETLTVDEGTWTGDATITFTYQWFRECGTVIEAISGETATTYEVTEDDIGCDIFCEVTGTNGCAPDGVADSNSLGPVPEPPSDPVNVTPPVISGVTLPGHSLVTTDGTWSGTPTSFTYQWQMNCGAGWNDLVGETADELLLTDAMIDCMIRCVVTAHNAEGDTPANSNELTITANVPAAVEICEGPPWRFVVTNLQMRVLTFLDRLARNRTVTYTLNGSAVATGTVPSDSPEINIPHTDGDPFLAEGNRLLLGFRLEPQGGGQFAWIIRYAGIILQLEDEARQDTADTQYTAYDPWQYLRSRPVRNGPDFDYTLPGINGSSYTLTKINVIAGEILHNTITTDGPVFIDAGVAYGGTSYWGGVIEDCEQIDINFQQGTSVGDAWDQLVSGNQADFILTPIYDPIRRPGYTHELSIFQQAGAIRDSSIFGWDKFPRNVVGISRLLEGSGRANKVKFFAGQGGTAVGGQTIPVQTDAASVTKFGEYWGQQFFPGQNVPAAVLALAEAQLEIRKNGRQTVTISPAPDCATAIFQEFNLGDRVPEYASDAFRAELVGYQRIYGIPISIADDSTETIERMLCSKEGLSS